MSYLHSKLACGVYHVILEQITLYLLGVCDKTGFQKTCQTEAITIFH